MPNRKQSSLSILLMIHYGKMLASLKQHVMASVPVNLNNTLQKACLSNIMASVPINLETTHCGKCFGQSKMAIDLAVIKKKHESSNVCDFLRVIK